MLPVFSFSFYFFFSALSFNITGIFLLLNFSENKIINYFKHTNFTWNSCLNYQIIFSTIFCFVGSVFVSKFVIQKSSLVITYDSIMFVVEFYFLFEKSDNFPPLSLVFTHISDSFFTDSLPLILFLINFAIASFTMKQIFCFRAVSAVL